MLEEGVSGVDEESDLQKINTSQAQRIPSNEHLGNGYDQRSAVENRV